MEEIVLTTMVRTPYKCCCMNGIRFIRDDTIRVEVPNFVGFLGFVCIFPLDLTVFIEYVCIFLTYFGFVPG